MLPRSLILIVLFLFTGAASAQSDTITDLTETERLVAEGLEQDGIHVVHFWAPWCHNSRHELRDGLWNRLVATHEDVTFTFVTVYNDGALGDEMLQRHGLPDRVRRLAQPDLRPSNEKSNRRRTFLGHALTWTPSTWIFHRNGQLATALNYGEMDEKLFDTLLNVLRAEW